VVLPVAEEGRGDLGRQADSARLVALAVAYPQVAILDADVVEQEFRRLGGPQPRAEVG
jgi:hypothetical protein